MWFLFCRHSPTLFLNLSSQSIDGGLGQTSLGKKTAFLGYELSEGPIVADSIGSQPAKLSTPFCNICWVAADSSGRPGHPISLQKGESRARISNHSIVGRIVTDCAGSGADHRLLPDEPGGIDRSHALTLR